MAVSTPNSKKRCDVSDVRMSNGSEILRRHIERRKASPPVPTVLQRPTPDTDLIGLFERLGSLHLYGVGHSHTWSRVLTFRAAEGMQGCFEDTVKALAERYVKAVDPNFRQDLVQGRHRHKSSAVDPYDVEPR